jgi:hypothetical protein
MHSYHITSQNAKENEMGKLKRMMMSLTINLLAGAGKEFLQAARSIVAELAILHEVSEWRSIRSSHDAFSDNFQVVFPPFHEAALPKEYLRGYCIILEHTHYIGFKHNQAPFMFIHIIRLSIIVEYIVEYIIESGRRERRERAETYNRLHCIE